MKAKKIKKKQITKYPEFDWLRGFAILGVVAMHTHQQYGDIPDLLKAFVNQGARGVQLFFVVSAWTLAASMLQRLDHDVHPWRDFYIRRLFRIIPLYWCGILLYHLVQAPGSEYWAPDGVSVSMIVSNIFIFQSWSIYAMNGVVPGGWSIGVEMTFYILFPLFFLLRKKPLWVPVAFLSSLWLAHDLGLKILFAKQTEFFFEHQQLVRDFVMLWFPTQLPVFIAGMGAFYASRLWERGRHPFLGWLMIAVAIVVGVYFGIGPFTEVGKQIVLGTAFALAVLGAHLNGGCLPFKKIIGSVGIVSYSIYLIHFAVLTGLKSTVPWFRSSFGNLGGYFVFYIFILAVTWLISKLTYKWIEENGIKLGRQWIKKLNRDSR